MKVTLEYGSYLDGSVAISLESMYIPSKNDYWDVWRIWNGPAETEAYYLYEFWPDDENRFYENGLLYNQDGSLAENTLVNKDFRFHGFCHASLDKLLSETVEPLIPSNFLYGLPAGDYDNLKRIAAVRDRLNVPDWLAFFITLDVINENFVRSVLSEVPDLFVTFSLKWILHVLKISQNDIDVFNQKAVASFKNPFALGTISYEDFCKIIELERNHTLEKLV